MSTLLDLMLEVARRPPLRPTPVHRPRVTLRELLAMQDDYALLVGWPAIRQKLIEVNRR